ncbi:hypothetical protein [Streptomyces xylophagus]|uniref:hypothetical protein n=1 Tax=Streptomyces xylophagus TaxID=285514 RepID=UPI0005BB4FE5|nr:hypothetical protein [Streptomyces xylophagus]
MAAPPVIARTARYFNTRVGRTELDKLLLVVGEGAPAGTVTVKCTVGSAQLQEDTLDDLIATRAALPYVSNRTPWTALTLDRDEGAARFVGVECKDGVVTVTVRSVDPIWTHGQMHRLGEILEEAHGVTFLPPYKRRLIQLGVMMLMLLGIGVLNAMSPKLQNDSSYAIMQGMIAATGAFILMWLLSLRLGLGESRPVLNILGDVQWGSTWSRLSTGDRIAIVSAAFAGLAVVVAAVALI